MYEVRACPKAPEAGATTARAFSTKCPPAPIDESFGWGAPQDGVHRSPVGLVLDVVRRSCAAPHWATTCTLTFVVGAVALTACRRGEPQVAFPAASERSAPPSTEPFGRCAEFTQDRRAFFGDLHLHTAFSLDANLQGTRLMPREAYRFARGEAVTAPGSNRSFRIDRPLDFAAVTDHAEFLGFVAACSDPSSRSFRSQDCKRFRKRPEVALFLVSAKLTKNFLFRKPPRACGPGREACAEHRESMWQALQDEAERAYDRSRRCRFTAFVGYEYSASPANNVLSADTIHNMHRNVIFRSTIVPRVPIDFFDAPEVQDLWRQLASSCTGNQSGCDAIAIPHNANLSAGRMFGDQVYGGPRDGLPIDVDYAREQAVFEPLMEIYQHKGSSECLPGQTAGDELCDFEVLPYNNLRSAKLDDEDDLSEVDTMRYGYGAGLRYRRSLGANPFAFGIIASTDGHLGLTGNVHEAMFVGGGGAGESASEDGGAAFPDRIYFGPGGLAGVWAEENSREAIFRALRRKETFGTSGPRIPVRMFGGWGFPSGWCGRRDAVTVAYANGVPMGGTLQQPPRDGVQPVFAVEAVADPGTRELPGVKLQRLQIIKGFLDDSGEPQTRVFDVAGDAGVGSDLDLSTCVPSRQGFERLCGVWRDETFRPHQDAYYYARVVEVPTCRWSTRLCVEHEYDCEELERDIDWACCDETVGLYPDHCGKVRCDEVALEEEEECCDPDVVRPVIQERAWGSPIWFSPE